MDNIRPIEWHDFQRAVPEQEEKQQEDIWMGWLNQGGVLREIEENRGQNHD